MQLSTTHQKALKAVHLVVASIWLTCVLLLALLPTLSSKLNTDDKIYMYNLIYHFIDMFVLSPAAVLTISTGLIYSVWTKWGFFKHGWLIYKWVVSLTLVISGIVYLGPMTTEMLKISADIGMLALQDSYYLFGQSLGLWVAILNTHRAGRSFTPDHLLFAV